MHQLLVAIAWLLASAALGLAIHQQPWQLPPEVVPSNSRARVWSLSTLQTHQRAFPPRPRNLTAAIDDDAGDPLHGWRARAAPAHLRWTLTNANRSISVDALLPSLVHLDLLRAGIIQDPAVGLNEGQQRWIAEEPAWTYTADLAPVLDQIRPTHKPTQHQYWLHFDGLDTVADVFLGGERLLRTRNQHTWHAVRIPSHLLEQPSAQHRNLTLVFHNINTYAAEQARRFDPGYPNQVESPTRSRTSDYAYPHRIFVRKQQSDFGWDWGPALMPVGPHKPAYLVELCGPASVEAAKLQQEVHVVDWHVDIYRKGQTNNLVPPDPDANWVVNVSLTLLTARRVERPSVRIAIPSLGVAMPDTLLSLPVIEAGLNERVHAAFEMHSSGEGAPLLWWPRGYGEPTLYTLEVHSDELHIHLRRRVGFRTAALDLSRIPRAQASSEHVQPGSHFRLLVNAREVYVVGTSLIPLDTLGPRAAPGYMHWLLDSAAAAHVNLLRIWGGGSYPSRELLDACDQMGMLVWLDTMFAASLYPAHDAFVADVRAEVAQAVAGVVSHASVVAVVGNNEGELYFLGGYGHRTRDAEWKRAYEMLFDHAVRDEVLDTTRALSYIPCSTTTGYVSLHPYRGRYTAYPHNELHGTGEHYGYDAARAWDIASYPRVRFMVEFGMFSLPSIHALDQILPSSCSDALEPACVVDSAGNLDYPLTADEDVQRFKAQSPMLRSCNDVAELACSVEGASNLSCPCAADEGVQRLKVGVQTGSKPQCTVDSIVMHAHLKHPPAGNLSYPFAADEGMQQLKAGVQTWFADPDQSGKSGRALLRRWTESSQLYHALFVANQVAEYRRGAARGERNRGLIVWQLNDVWTGTTWSSVEYSGSWKLAHYTLACAQAPVAPVAIYNTSNSLLDIGVVYTGASHEGGYLVVEWFDFYGTLLEERRFGVHVEEDVGWWRAWQLNPTQLCRDTRCYVRLALVLTGTEVVSYWTHMPSLAASLARVSTHARPIITLHAHHPPDAEHWHIRITNTGTATAPWLTLTSNMAGYFAHPTTLAPTNAFFLNPNAELTLVFVRATSGTQTYKDWFDQLTASSLLDNLPPHTP